MKSAWKRIHSYEIMLPPNSIDTFIKRSSLSIHWRDNHEWIDGAPVDNLYKRGILIIKNLVIYA
jgi:hypothetical protein